MRGAAEFRPLAQVIGWQECSNEEVRLDLRESLPDYGHWTFNANNFGPGMNSFSWDPGVVALDGRPWFERASEGRAGVSPARFVCVLPLRIVGTSVSLSVINCHFISQPHATDWRAAQWASNMRVLDEVIAKVTAQGRLPIVLGDFNKKAADLIPGLVDLPTDPLTIDRIGVPESVTGVAELGTKAGSDHQPVIAHLVIKE